MPGAMSLKLRIHTRSMRVVLLLCFPLRCQSQMDRADQGLRFRLSVPRNLDRSLGDGHRFVQLVPQMNRTGRQYARLEH